MKEFLSQNNIEFVEKDIGADKEARAELIKRKITGVPTTIIDGEAVVGFDKEKIEELLGL